MSANQPRDEAAGDQRAETVTSRPPGGAATEAATRAAVAEKRQWVLELTNCIIKNWLYDN
jgi:hypothetical protein